MSIQRAVSGFRFAEIRRGDTLQRLAARELGDASRWPELVGLNALVAPFLTDDPDLAGAGVMLSGQVLRVPAAASTITADASPEEVFGRDVEIAGGQISVVGGDFGVVGGRDNLKQALSHRVVAERGDLVFHPDFGALLRRVIGVVHGPTATLLAAQYARAAVLADPRVSSVRRAEATMVGDSITVEIEAVPVTGKAVDISVTI